jgi:hypothetical protein
MNGLFGTSTANKNHSADLADGSTQTPTFAAVDSASSSVTDNSIDEWDVTDQKPIISCLVSCSASTAGGTCNILAKVTF